MGSKHSKANKQQNYSAKMLPAVKSKDVPFFPDININNRPLTLFPFVTPGTVEEVMEAVKLVSEADNILVRGYIREQQYELFGDELQKSAYYKIPQLVGVYCQLYYRQQISLSTPNDYNYAKWFEVNQAMKYIEFNVKARNDAHIALGDAKSHSGKHWEIVIGGWNNTQSVMRKRNQGRHYKVRQHRPLHGNQFKSFWIKWDENGDLEIGSGATAFMSFPYDADIPIKYMSVCTGWGASGEWFITL